jgi:hypothetical protein
MFIGDANDQQLTDFAEFTAEDADTALTLQHLTPSCVIFVLLQFNFQARNHTSTLAGYIIYICMNICKLEVLFSHINVHYGTFEISHLRTII